MDTKQIEVLGNKLSPSVSRFPYTYHHDLLIRDVFDLSFSRSDIAERFRNESEIEILAVGFLGMMKLDYTGVDFIKKTNENDLKLAKEIIEFAETILDHIKKEYERELLSRIPS